MKLDCESPDTSRPVVSGTAEEQQADMGLNTAVDILTPTRGRFVHSAGHIFGSSDRSVQVPS